MTDFVFVETGFVIVIETGLRPVSTQIARINGCSNRYNVDHLTNYPDYY
jgi:hypothetical protein